MLPKLSLFWLSWSLISILGVSSSSDLSVNFLRCIKDNSMASFTFCYNTKKMTGKKIATRIFWNFPNLWCQALWWNTLTPRRCWLGAWTTSPPSPWWHTLTPMVDITPVEETLQISTPRIKSTLLSMMSAVISTVISAQFRFCKPFLSNLVIFRIQKPIVTQISQIICLNNLTILSFLIPNETFKESTQSNLKPIDKDSLKKIY